MIIVTGGAGFIGSNIVKGLNQRGHNDIVVVDDLTDGMKFNNLIDCHIMDYVDKDEFISRIKQREWHDKINLIFHQGACSATTEWNGKFMLENNYEYSKILFHYCQQMRIPFIYASSAAVYGNNKIFKESPENEKPLNIYGYSKLLFDQYVRRHISKLKSQVVGLRYFNVYGPRESHKQAMASVAFHLNKQVHDTGVVKLFEGSHGYGNGEQRRDFVYVNDAVNVNLWFMENTKQSGIFNVGTGRSQTFNDVAKAVLAWHNRGKLKYIPFPEQLREYYQSFTQADISALRQAGYDKEFNTVDEGVKDYLDWL